MARIPRLNPPAAPTKPAPAAAATPETRPMHPVTLEALRLAVEERTRTIHEVEARFNARLDAILPEAEKLDGVTVADGWGVDLAAGQWVKPVPQPTA